jgi:hypothetical protein
MLLERYETPSKTQGTKVTLEWRHGRDDKDSWNEICAWVIEQFGMPGTLYTWHPTEDYMQFYFHREQDAIHFMLRWS